MVAGRAAVVSCKLGDAQRVLGVARVRTDRGSLLEGGELLVVVVKGLDAMRVLEGRGLVHASGGTRRRRLEGSAVRPRIPIGGILAPG